MKLLSILIITFFQITSLAWAQNDTIPKKNKESKIHVGAYYSIGFNRFSINSDLNVESYNGPYQNFGFMVETKLYKKLWLELNINQSLKREANINITKDSLNTDFLIKETLEPTVFLYLKYNVWQRKKLSLMPKIGLGFGIFEGRIYYKDNAKNQPFYPNFYTLISNDNYYTFSTGVDLNYKIKPHLIVFSQILFNSGVNILKEPYYHLYNSSQNRYIYIEKITPQTFIYSLGIKF